MPARHRAYDAPANISAMQPIEVEPSRRSPWLAVVLTTLGLAAIVLLAGIFLNRKPPGPPGPAAAPPLAVSFRDSKVPLQGKVAGINNTSSQQVAVSVVYVSSKGDAAERSYRLDASIAPQDSITLGWAELDGWKLKPGDKVRLQCEGFAKTFDFEVK
jgi:hypothetical protein